MINWRDGKAGFVGASKRFIKGFFEYAHAVTTDSVINPGPGFGVGSVITNNGIGTTGTVANDGIGQAGAIVFGFGVGSRMTNHGIGTTGTISNDGIGKVGDI
jgi:hypothetical protein